MAKSYILTVLVFIVLISGCSEKQPVQEETLFRTYVIDGSENAMKSYTIEEYQEVDLEEQYRKDRQEIESYRKYRAARRLADNEKEERERLECYESAGKNESEYYLEECES